MAAADSTPVEDPYYPFLSNPEIDTLHYNLALTWSGTRLTGVVSVIFRTTRATQVVHLDLLSALAVSAVEMDGRSTTYTRAGDLLAIRVGQVTPGSQHSVTIDYAGVPARVPAPSGRADMANGLGWSVDDQGNVYTFQEPWGAFTWYPVNDSPSDKALYDAQITVPRGQVAVFNGSLLGQHPAPDGRTTFDWRLSSPTASYLTTIAIGPYHAYHQTMPDGTPATYWLLPQDSAMRARLENESKTAFTWLEQRLGPYPFSTFGVVIVGGESGMETQTMITLSRGSLDRPDAVIAHEIAHQWFGDAVTPTDWKDLWLNEGWAMYMQQWFESSTGQYEYDGGISKWRPIDNQSRSVSGPPGEYNPKRFADLNVYLGPAMMLDAIRKRVGDAEFDTIARQWVSEHEYGNVSRAEFVSWLSRKTGQDFTGLVHLWLDSPHTPQ